MGGLPCDGSCLALRFRPCLLVFLVIILVSAGRNAFLAPGSICAEPQVQTRVRSRAEVEAARVLAPVGASSAPLGAVAGLRSPVQLPLPHGSAFRALQCVVKVQQVVVKCACRLFGRQPFVHFHGFSQMLFPK